MISLEEILKKEEEETIVPVELKERLLAKILKIFKRIKPN